VTGAVFVVICTENGLQHMYELCVKRLCFADMTMANGATFIFGEFNGVEIIRGGIFVLKFSAQQHYCESL
jgi:hypothetical protein